MNEREEELYQHYRIKVDEGQALLRIDRYLMDRLPNISRNKIQEGIKAGHVLVNEVPVKPNYRVRPQDIVTVMMPYKPEEFVVIPQDIPLDVIYEDEQLLVVNKPAGMVVHPGHGNWDGTLVNALTFRFKDLPTSHNGEMKPGLVHRIDKDTSGLLVIAKTEHAMTHLARQFFYKTSRRTYLALAWGSIQEEQGTIEGYIGRSFLDKRKRTVFPDGVYGKHAVTHYKVLRHFKYVTLVECKLETGRTHQIRVHFQHIGHPLFGDVMYGGNKILKGDKFTKYKSFVENLFQVMPRQALHAQSLGFEHPTTGEQMDFSCDLPEDFHQVLKAWDDYAEETWSKKF